ncbi:MAG: hypothetical protein AABW52_05720 [Nanoarchaeota archaeon]
MVSKINYSGLNDLSKDEQFTLKSIMEKHFPKVARLLNEDSELFVYIKVLKKESRKRFNINLTLRSSKNTFKQSNKDTEKGGDWDLAKSVHKSMDALENEVQHKLKIKEKSWKKFSLKRLFIGKP